MQRFIFRFPGGAAAPDDHAGIIRQRCRVIDESTKMFLIEAEQADVDKLLADLPGWKASKEVQYRVPEQPLSVVKPPKGKRVPSLP